MIILNENQINDIANFINNLIKHRKNYPQTKLKFEVPIVINYGKIAFDHTGEMEYSLDYCVDYDRYKEYVIDIFEIKKSQLDVRKFCEVELELIKEIKEIMNKNNWSIEQINNLFDDIYYYYESSESLETEDNKIDSNNRIEISKIIPLIEEIYNLPRNPIKSFWRNLLQKDISNLQIEKIKTEEEEQKEKLKEEDQIKELVENMGIY